MNKMDIIIAKLRKREPRLMKKLHAAIDDSQKALRQEIKELEEVGEEMAWFLEQEVGPAIRAILKAEESGDMGSEYGPDTARAIEQLKEVLRKGEEDAVTQDGAIGVPGGGPPVGVSPEEPKGDDDGSEGPRNPGEVQDDS